MLLKRLQRVYVYEPIEDKIDGEIFKKWKLIDKPYFFNIQQDINELDTNSSGYVDFERRKLRSDKYFDIEKSYGISLMEQEIDDEGILQGKPQYEVVANPKIGNSIIYICETYNGK